MIGWSSTPYRQYFSQVRATQWDVWEHLKTEKEQWFLQITCWFVEKLKGKNVSSIICYRLYHMSQSLVSKYPISKWNLSLRILTRIIIHNIIIEKKNYLDHSYIFFFFKFRGWEIVQSILEKKIEEIRIRTGAKFLPKIEPPPPPKKTNKKPLAHPIALS